MPEEALTFKQFKENNNDLFELISDSKIGIIGHLPGAEASFFRLTRILDEKLGIIVECYEEMLDAPKKGKPKKDDPEIDKLLAQVEEELVLFKEQQETSEIFKGIIREPWKGKDKSYTYRLNSSSPEKKTPFFCFFPKEEKAAFLHELKLSNGRAMEEILTKMDPRYKYKVSRTKKGPLGFKVSCIRTAS